MKKNKEKRPWIPRGLYSILSRSNKVNLWTVGLGCFVTIFTFWLGLSYQYTIVTNNRKESQKAIHYNMLNYATKQKAAYNANVEDVLSNNITMSLKKIMNDSTYVEKYENLILNEGWENVIENIRRAVLISERAKYYFPEEKYRQISFNNLKIAEILDEYYSIIDSKRTNYFINYEFLVQNKGNNAFYHELLDSLKYFRDNYTFKSTQLRTYIDEKYKGYDIYMMWHNAEKWYLQYNPEANKEFEDTFAEAIEVAKKNDSIDAATIETLTQQLDTIKSQKEKISKQSLYFLLKVRSWIMNEMTLIISQNYHIINDEVRPLGDNIINEKDEFKHKIEPGYALAILSLIIIIPIGYFFWYITIMFIFKKAEEPNKDSKDDWNTQKELKNEVAILSAIADLYSKFVRESDTATKQDIIIEEPVKDVATAQEQKDELQISQ